MQVQFAQFAGIEFDRLADGFRGGFQGLPASFFQVGGFQELHGSNGGVMALGVWSAHDHRQVHAAAFERGSEGLEGRFGEGQRFRRAELRDLFHGGLSTNRGEFHERLSQVLMEHRRRQQHPLHRILRDQPRKGIGVRRPGGNRIGQGGLGDRRDRQFQFQVGGLRVGVESQGNLPGLFG